MQQSVLVERSISRAQKIQLDSLQRQLQAHQPLTHMPAKASKSLANSQGRCVYSAVMEGFAQCERDIGAMTGRVAHVLGLGLKLLN